MNSVDFVEDNSHFIETELKDILTLNSCTTLVSELIKFILYRKQQLPYTFDRLKYLITKRNSKEKQENKKNASSSIERQFKVAEDGLATLELLFEKTKEELADPSKGCISEVVLLFGSTPMNPKQVYRIHLPEICLNHSSVNHPERKHLFHLLQSVILSNNLSTMLTKPMNPTNMFIFIKKNINQGDIIGIDDNINKWFVPKNRYQIPKIGQHFHIKFRHPDAYMAKCTCQNFKIHSDNSETSIDSEFVENQEKLESDESSKSIETKWYQACAIFKGFTDVYINGVSVADLWLSLSALRESTPMSEMRLKDQLLESVQFSRIS